MLITVLSQPHTHKQADVVIFSQSFRSVFDSPLNFGGIMKMAGTTGPKACTEIFS